jgi:hypothetical protein
LNTQERVLPSGRFATMRPLTWLDRVLSYDENVEARIMRMACRVVRIDGGELTLADAASMSLVEANPIIDMVTLAWAASMQSKGIA